MTDYIVAIIVPFKHKVTYSVVKNLEEAKEIYSNKMREHNDIIVLKRDIDNEGVERITLEKIGYAKVYQVLNIIFVLLGVSLLFIFSYLYYKFFYIKN